jgi:hypothetical protein
MVMAAMSSLRSLPLYVSRAWCRLFRACRGGVVSCSCDQVARGKNAPVASRVSVTPSV